MTNSPPVSAAGLGAIADLGFVGLDDSGPVADGRPGGDPLQGCPEPAGDPRAENCPNTALAAVRAPVEHGFAHLKNWRVLGILDGTGPAEIETRIRALHAAARDLAPSGFRRDVIVLATPLVDLLHDPDRRVSWSGPQHL